MDTKTRRINVQRTLFNASNPIKASQLASQFGVSRQTIVGDVALLRATGEQIIPTPQGYQYLDTDNVLMTVVCRHFPDETVKELELIVSNGGTIKDVEVEHPIYGLLHGELNISSKADIKSFNEKVQKADSHLLSELTNGIHTHVITADSKEQLEQIKQSLKSVGYLYE